MTKLLKTSFILTLLGYYAPYAKAESLVQSTFDEINPARNFTSDGLIGQILGGTNGNQGLLALAIAFAGMILVLLIIMGGYSMLMNPTNPQAQEAGKNRITWAIIGFFVVFSAYWIMQIIQVMFGFDVLGGEGTPPTENNQSCSGFCSYYNCATLNPPSSFASGTCSGGLYCCATPPQEPDPSDPQPVE